MDMATVAWEALQPLPFIDSQRVSKGQWKCNERRDGVAQIGGLLHPLRCNVVAVGDGGKGLRGLVLQRNEVRDLREH